MHAHEHDRITHAWSARQTILGGDTQSQDRSRASISFYTLIYIFIVDSIHFHREKCKRSAPYALAPRFATLE